MDIPIITDTFGFYFRVKAAPDHKTKSIDIRDEFGRFLPVPFKTWAVLVDSRYYPYWLQ